MASSLIGKPREWTRREAATLIAIVVFAFALRVAFDLSVHVVPVSDFGWYYDHALAIVRGFGYTEHGRATAFWPPGWPYVLAGIIRVFGPSVLTAQTIQAIFNALAAGVVFLSARLIGGSLCATLAGLAYAVLPSAIEWSSTLASEPLFTLLWVTVTYVWIRRSTNELGWYALSGVLLGLTSLVRPSALLLCGVLALYFLLLPGERSHPLRAAKAIVVTAICMLIVTIPTLVRDYQTFGTFVLISNNGGVSLYQGNNPKAGPGYSELTDPEVARLISDPRTEVQGDRLASKRAMDYIKAHPQHVVALSLRKIAALYRRDDLAIRFTFRSGHFREQDSPPPSDRTATLFAKLSNSSYGALMVFAILGIALAVTGARRPQHPGWILLLGMILYNTATYALIFGIDRYRYPTMPFFAVFSGLGALAVVAYVREALSARVRAAAEP